MAGALLAMALLGAMGWALRLPVGGGIEPLLGWTSPARVQAAVQAWCGTGGGVDGGVGGGAAPSHALWRVAALYVLGDTAVFMPFYALAVGLGLQRLAPPAWLRRATLASLLLLLLVDAAENLGGALRLGLPTALFAAAAACGLGLGVALLANAQGAWPRGLVLRPGRSPRRMLLHAALAAVLLLGLGALWPGHPAACQVPPQGLAAPGWGALAHQGKQLFSASTVALLLACAWAARRRPSR
jgi:hypothetical protein